MREKTVVQRKTVDGTGVPEGTRCSRCGITAEESRKLPPVQTGIDHPEYRLTHSFYRSGGCGTGKPETHMCPRCHRETELEKAMAAMDAYAARHGEDALAKRMGLR